ncbi:ABC transporter permease subunit [Clostridium gasigenes]|uniref:ABC transporter permease subunit n=1 Tax=Clostridium gasigenes TaxID=94869 RepID=UPI001C0E1A21|nr:ABC transporter permease subunit [Clostridium gasigenes]MBU3137451.1 ABC transporter permease subunit [Clostridium gasigenes]
MKKFDVYLYDSINRQYDRKNMYLYEVATLQEKIEDATGNEKDQLSKKLKDLIGNKSNHEYNKKLVDYKNKEKLFLIENKKKVTELKGKLDKTLSTNAKRLEIRLFKAREIEMFYENYVDLTYDAELITEQCKLEIMQIPAVIEFEKESIKVLNKAINKKMNVSEIENKKFQEEFKRYKIQEKKKVEDRIKEVKIKQKDGIISKKAKNNIIEELNRKYDETILVKSFECEKKYNKEIIRNKKYELSKVVKQRINTVNVNVSDLRRVYAIESEKTFPIISYCTFLVPGLGQLLNKQYMKSLIMFFATIYIYAAAIPYALGYGNYKGNGIAGLVTLAANSGKLDRSIIFMIEGILAIFLVVIALMLIYMSFKDVNTVEKDVIKGTRYRVWTETRQIMFEDGFPYLVLSPAAIVTIFIVFIPVVTTILISFTGMGPETQAKFGWAAFDNYKMLILGQGMVGSIFWGILGWTVIWTIGASTLGIGLGFILAITLNNDRIKGRAIFRTIYLLPWAVPSFLTIMFFSILLADNGAVVTFLQGIFGEGFSIKNDPFVSRIAVICMQSWLGSAYVFMLSTGVLQSISSELYEAADIDGATNFNKLTKITIPLVLFQTAPLLVGQYVFNFNNFGLIYLFNSGGPFDPTKYGNLAGSTDLLITYIYKLTIENQYQALGAAITVIISVALIGISYVGYKNTDAFRRE